MTIAFFQFNELSPAVPGTAASSLVVAGSLNASANPGVASDVSLYASITVAAILRGATGGSLDVYLQNSHDDGVTWFDYMHYATMAAAAPAANFVWSASTGAQSGTIVQVGINATPSLPANTIVGGTWGGRFRMMMVAGAGTTAGALQKITITGQVAGNSYRS